MSEKKLVRNDGSEVKVGDTVTSFRGEAATIKRIEKPARPGSTGKVETTLGVHYPGVYNLSWRE
jgi:hypothetical protein